MNRLTMEPVPEPPDDLGEMQRRLARLETGVRLLAETLRRVHADLSGTLSDLREEVVLTATSVDVRRVVMEAIRPVEAALESLATALGEAPAAVEEPPSGPGTEPDDEREGDQHDEEVLAFDPEPLAFDPEPLKEAAPAPHPSA